MRMLRFLCLGGFGLFPGLFCAAAPVTLTFTEALQRVESTNLTVLISRESVAQAIEAAVQTRSNLLPNVTLNASQRRNLSASVGANVVVSGITNRFDAQLSGRLDLLNPSNLAQYKAAKMAIAVAQLGETEVRQAIMATVASTYFAHLRNLERITVLDDNISRAQSLRELAQNQLNAGVATQIDVTRADSQLAVAEQARLQQDTVVQASELQLKQLLSLDMGESLYLAAAGVRRTTPGIYTPGEAEMAYDRRPEMQSARSQLEQNELEVKAARYGRLPSLALIGTYGYATATAFDGGEAKVWSGSLALSLPVFDGSRVKSLTNYALSRRRAQELRVRDLEHQISAELRLARQDATSRLAQITVAEKGLALASEELELAQKRFEQGVADNREIIEAQARLSDASDNLVEAVYRYNVSRVELARARGDVRLILGDNT